MSRNKRVVVVIPRTADGHSKGDPVTGRDMVRELGPGQQSFGPGRGGEPGNIFRRLAEVGGHPDATEFPASEGGLEHLIAVGGLHQQAVALLQPIAVAQGGCECGRPRLQFCPGPGYVTPDEADVVRMSPGGVRQELRQVHHPCGNGLHHATRSRIEA